MASAFSFSNSASRYGLGSGGLALAGAHRVLSSRSVRAALFHILNMPAGWRAVTSYGAPILTLERS